MDASVRLGNHPSFESAMAAMARTAETREPDPAAHETHEQPYREL